MRATAQRGASTRNLAGEATPQSRVPTVARVVVVVIRMVPTVVTIAFAAWAVAAAVAGDGEIVLAAALMSLLALGVAIRSRGGGRIV